MRNFFVSDKQIVPAQGAPVLGMLVASWPWPCQQYDQTKNGHLIFFFSGNKSVGYTDRIGGLRLGPYSQDWGAY